MKLVCDTTEWGALLLFGDLQVHGGSHDQPGGADRARVKSQVPLELQQFLKVTYHSPLAYSLFFLPRGSEFKKMEVEIKRGDMKERRDK